ncbi:hypothetical protein QO230_00635 [Vibrio vulnificus]|uniref:hypothetical protein n=1 Tax=Vibrio vulnificus TaxID=672 RepID=UPI0024DF6889|nr:hypothetical protein [Vibrio vulnificus]MDK2606121.1 hypothetical protein [Vibrio vulnificus]MDK2609865.1 hypothetical protein [Vibrio vulnificus]MDK2627363.1 hypothetical protein [Vibrio vulnificus]MDK2702808.1 hypothetical protein [Vibrio vulnificus]
MRDSKGRLQAGHRMGLADPVTLQKAIIARQASRRREAADTVEVSQADYQLLKRIKDLTFENNFSVPLETLLLSIPKGFKRQIKSALKNNQLFETLDQLIQQYIEDKGQFSKAQQRWIMHTVCVSLLPNEPLGKLREDVLMARERERLEAEEEKAFEAKLAELFDDLNSDQEDLLGD